MGSFLLVAVLFVFKQDTGSRLDRYFRSLSYAITDRRLLIFEGDELTHDYRADRIRSPRVRERAPGFGDVIFNDQSSASFDSRGNVLERDAQAGGFQGDTERRRGQADRRRLASRPAALIGGADHCGVPPVSHLEGARVS